MATPQVILPTSPKNKLSQFLQRLHPGKVLTILLFAPIVMFWCVDSVAGQHPGLRVAMVQMDIVDGNLTENILRAEKNIREAAGKKVDLICLPEAADLGWLYQNARADAQPIPGKYTDILSSLAKELNVWISAGCLEKDADKTYNSAVLIDRSGKIVLKHRKINTLPELTGHLYDAGSIEDIEVVDTEFGRVGLTICADNFDIANPQKVSDMGAWLLITPHGYAAKESNQVDNAVSFINQIKHIAKTTELWVVGTDAGLSLVTGGAWKGQQHSGCSTIADPTGRAVVFGKVKEADLVIYGIAPEE